MRDEAIALREAVAHDQRPFNFALLHPVDDQDAPTGASAERIRQLDARLPPTPTE